MMNNVDSQAKSHQAIMVTELGSFPLTPGLQPYTCVGLIIFPGKC